MPKKSKKSRSDSKSNNQKDGYTTLSLNEEESPISTSHSRVATTEKMEQIFNFTETHKKTTLKKVAEENQINSKHRKDLIEDANKNVQVHNNLILKPGLEELRKEMKTSKSSKVGSSKSWAYSMSGQSWNQSPIMTKILPSNRSPTAPLENVQVRLLPREDFLLSGEIPKVDDRLLAQCNKCECVICPSGSKTHINDPEHCKVSSLNLASLKDLNTTKKNSKQRKSKKPPTPKALPPVPLFGDKQASSASPSGSGLISSIKVLVLAVNLNDHNNVKDEKVTVETPVPVAKKIVEPVIKQESEKIDRVNINTDKFMSIDPPILEKSTETPVISDLLQNVVTPKKKSTKSKIYRRSKKDKKPIVEIETPYTEIKIKEEVDTETIIEILDVPREPSPLPEPMEVKVILKEEKTDEIDVLPTCDAKIIPSPAPASIMQPINKVEEKPPILFETFDQTEKTITSNIQFKAKVTFLPVNPPPTCYSSVTPQSKVPNIQQNYNTTIYTSHPKPLLSLPMRSIRKVGSTYLLQNQRLDHQREEIHSLLNKRHNMNNIYSTLNTLHRPNILKNSARANISRINAKRASTDKLADSPKRSRPNDMNTFILHTEISDPFDNMVNSRPKELANNYTACNTDYFR